MARIVYFVACSLDGKIARTDGDVDWLFSDDEYGYEEFYANIGVLLMGRKTFELVQTFGDWPYADRQTYVFSRSMADSDLPSVETVQTDPAAFVNNLSTQSEKDIWLVGGATLAEQLLAVDQVDRLIISIHPIILGGGLPLFPDGVPESTWGLRKWKTYDSGLVQLTYDRA